LKGTPKNNDAQVFKESFFPEEFRKAVQKCYMESMEPLTGYLKIRSLQVGDVRSRKSPI
jgi:hypothetical protein